MAVGSTAVSPVQGRRASYRDPARNEKIRRSRIGKPRPKNVIESLRRANLGRKPSVQRLRRQQEARERRWPMSYAPWTPEHDEIVRTKSIKDGCGTHWSSNLSNPPPPRRAWTFEVDANIVAAKLIATEFKICGIHL